MRGANTFSKKERICLNTEIDTLFSYRQGFIAYPFRVVYKAIPKDDVEARILISVPKKRIPHAVDRNKIKRRIREAYRTHKHPLTEACLQSEMTMLIAFIYIADRKILPFKTIEGAIVEAIDKITTTISTTEPCFED